MTVSDPLQLSIACMEERRRRESMLDRATTLVRVLLYAGVARQPRLTGQ